MENNSSALNISFLLIVGIVLITGIIGAVLWAQTLPSISGEAPTAAERQGFWAAFHQGQKLRLTPTPGGTADESTGESSEPGAAGAGEINLDEVIAAINTGGCTACHTIPGIPNAIGQVGPNLSNIGVDAATRREGYTAEEYIRESLKDPTAFTAPECPTGPCITGTMPVLQLNDAQIDAIVSYLITLGVDEVSMTPQ